MTAARRTLDRMTCNTCGRQVAFRLIRPPKVNRGRPIPGIRKPVRHKRLEPGCICGGHLEDQYCPAGEP